MTCATLLFDIDLDATNRKDDLPWGIIYCLPVLGDFWVIISPIIFTAVVMVFYAEKLMKIRANLNSRRATKAKLVELRNLQIKAQEAELDRELEQARYNYNKRQTT